MATAQLQMSPSTNTPLNIVVAINRAAPADWATSIEAVRGLLNQLGVDNSVGVVAYNRNTETLIAPAPGFGRGARRLGQRAAGWTRRRSWP